jgi:hypothetical protein
MLNPHGPFIHFDEHAVTVLSSLAALQKATGLSAICAFGTI